MGFDIDKFNYKAVHYDQIRDDGTMKAYEFIKDGIEHDDFFVTVETYTDTIVPMACKQPVSDSQHLNTRPMLHAGIYANGVQLSKVNKVNFDNSVILGNLFLNDNRRYTKFIFQIQYDWFNFPYTDYTITLYTDQDNPMLFEHKSGQSNQFYTDGREPKEYDFWEFSGFREFCDAYMDNSFGLALSKNWKYNPVKSQVDSLL